MTNPASQAPRLGRLASIFSASTTAIQQKAESKLDATEENVLKVWRKYLEVESEKENSAFYINFIKVLEPKWEGNGVMRFETDNNMAISALDRLKVDIVQYIKERVDMDQLQITTHLLETEERQARTYVTLEEQLSEVKQVNPAVGLLIQKLGLDL